MRISFAANHGEIGGGEVMLLAMTEAARELGHDVQIVAPDSPSSVKDAAMEAGFPVIAITGDGTAGYLTGLRRWSRSARQGLLWCNGLRPALVTAGQPNRVVHLHQQPTGKLKAAAWAAARGAKAVVVPSELMKEQVGLGATVVENWTSPFNASPHSLPLPEAGATIGFLGRLSPDKGVDILARAVALLQQRAPGRVQLLLAGEPRFVTEDQVAVVEDALRPIHETTTRAGWMSREDFFSQVDLAVFPSVWEEPFGLVAAEAMSAGCPFVITDAGALPSVAGPHFPWVAASADAEDLAKVISAALEGYAESQVAESRDRWERQFSPEAGRERLAQLLAALEVPR